MQLAKARLTKGLTAVSIKCIALIFMTLDHLAVYGSGIPLFDAHYAGLRIVGRIAAPLFFFTLTESVRYTHSRPKFLLRLYRGAIAVGLFTTITNFFFGDSVGVFAQSNILFTFFYTAWYIIMIEDALLAWKERNLKKALLCLIGIAATCIPHYLLKALDAFPPNAWEMNPEYSGLIRDIIASFLSSPRQCEYGIVFIVMGTAMYFAPTKYAKAAVLAVFSLFGFCMEGFLNLFGKIIPFYVILALQEPQGYMILAVPFILLYNGRKGKGNKWLFYAYYPLHRYVIAVIGYFYQALMSA